MMPTALTVPLIVKVKGLLFGSLVPKETWPLKVPSVVASSWTVNVVEAPGATVVVPKPAARLKPEGSVGWVNGGFFVASAAVLDYIEDDTTVFERAPLERLAAAGELGAFQHHGFWHGMDTLWDKIYLNGLWDEGRAPWKLWVE